jgi:hypothetical protein
MPLPSSPVQGVSVQESTAETGKRQMSAAGRARIIAATKKRWALFHKQKTNAGGTRNANAAVASSGKRIMSAEARARIAAAQKARWAAARTGGASSNDNGNGKPPSGKRRMSPAARKAIAEAARRRWAAAKAAGKSRL